MSQKKATIKDFSRGMQPTQRSSQFGFASLVKNFDISEDNQLLKPVPAWEDWMSVEDKKIGIVNIGGSQGSSLVYGVGNALSNWFARDWRYRVRITPDSTGAVDYVFFDLSNMPSEFWDNVNEDGSDVRITNTENTPIQSNVVKIDTTAQTGSVIFKGDLDEYHYIYFGNSEATELTNLWEMFDASQAYPLINNDYDYAHDVSTHDDYDLDQGADFEASDIGYIGYGHKGSIMYTDNEPPYYPGRIRDEANMSCVIRSLAKPPAYQYIMSDGNNGMEVEVTTAGVIRLWLNFDGTGSYYYLGTTDVCDGEVHHISCEYNDSSGDIYIIVDGVVDYHSVQSPSYDLDGDGMRFHVRPPSNASMIEFVTLKKNGTKGLERMQREGKMIGDNSIFWQVGVVQDINSVSLEYDGVQIWQKTLGEDSWTEYLVNGLPVKNPDYYPMPSFVLYSSGNIWTTVHPSDTLYPSSSINRISKIGFEGIDWAEDYAFIFEAMPRSAFTADKKSYINIGSSLSQISGSTYTDNYFSTYATGECLTPFGQYLAIGSDYANNSVAQLWDLSSDVSSEFIDFGTGSIRVLGRTSGALFGVMSNMLDEEELSNGEQALEIKVWEGGSYASPFLSFKSPSLFEDDDTGGFKNPVLNQVEYIKNGFVFYAKIYDADNNLQQGLFSLTKNAKNGTFALALLRDTTGINVVQIYRTGNVLFLVDGEGGIYRSSIDDYSTSSVWQSTWYGGTSIDIEDQVKSIEVTFEPLDTGQEIKLEVRTDDLDWQTVFTHTETNSTKREAKVLEAIKKNFPKFKEMQLRLTSTNGSAGVTSISVELKKLLDG